jgi:hypothetical protein
MTSILKWYGTIKWNENSIPMKNGIRETFKCENCESFSSLTKTPFIGGANGVVLTRTSTIQVGENVRTLLEVPLVVA